MKGAPYVHSFVNFKFSLFANLLRLILSYNIVCVCVSLKFISTAVHNVILIENIKDLSNFVSFSWLPPLGAGWYGAGWDTVSRCPNTVASCPTSVTSCAQFYPSPILSQAGQKKCLFLPGRYCLKLPQRSLTLPPYCLYLPLSCLKQPQYCIKLRPHRFIPPTSDGYLFGNPNQYFNRYFTAEPVIPEGIPAIWLSELFDLNNCVLAVDSLY